MSKQARRELLLSLQPEYRETDWRGKQALLDGFIAATGYDRKYAIWLMNNGPRETDRKRKRERKRQYGKDIQDLLIEIWRKAGNRLCSKRLVMVLPVLIAKMEKFKHLQISEEQKGKLLSLSPATIDRLLRPERAKYGRGRSTTKPGFLLKKQIAVRTSADWNNVKPGFVEVDLVAHCGDNLHGRYLNTLTATDIATTWTETVAVLGKKEGEILAALSEVREFLPFPLLGLDTDNGSEFLNWTLASWCEEHSIKFTRGREGVKNDQAHVEEKNGSVVRRLVGYDRYEGVESWQLLSTLYRISRLYINYFQPTMKLERKSRDGARIYRKYEKAKTPFERVLMSSAVPEARKEELRREFEQLDPVLLLSEIDRMQNEFWRTAVTEVDSPSVTESNDSPLPDPVSNILCQLKEPAPIRSRREKRQRRRAANATQPKKRGKRSNLDEVWDEVNAALEADQSLLHPARILEWLNERYPGRFGRGQSRTVKRWLLKNHPDKEWSKGRKRGRKTALDDIWAEVCQDLANDPTLSNRQISKILRKRHPEKMQMIHRTTVRRRLKQWRSSHLKTSTSTAPLCPDLLVLALV